MNRTNKLLYYSCGVLLAAGFGGFAYWRTGTWVNAVGLLLILLSWWLVIVPLINRVGNGSRSARDRRSGDSKGDVG